MVIATPISLGLSLAPKTSRRHQTWEWRSDRHLLGGGFKYFLFSPLPGEMIQFDEHIFQMGWFNHQLEMVQSPPQIQVPKRIVCTSSNPWWSASGLDWQTKQDFGERPWVYWAICLGCSKNFPTYPWNIPKRPPTNGLWRNSFHLGVKGFLGYAPRVCWGFLRDMVGFGRIWKSV